MIPIYIMNNNNNNNPLLLFLLLLPCLIYREDRRERGRS